MATNKKPRKSYRAKPIIQPLKQRDHWLLEGGVHAAIVALKAGCVTDNHLHDLGAHGMLVQRLARADSIEHTHAESILRVVSEVLDKGYSNRFDVEAIAASVSITMDFLRDQRNHDIAKTSIDMVREFDKRKGAL